MNDNQPSDDERLSEQLSAMTCPLCGFTLPDAAESDVRLEAVKALHAEDVEWIVRGDGGYNWPWCRTCLVAWPCPTYRAAQGSP